MMSENAESLDQSKEGVLELTPEEVATIDLIITKEQLAAAEEKLAAMQLREAQRKLMDTGKRKAVLLAKVGARVGGRIKSAKIVGQSKLAYELE
jgi:hypothetical protein